VVAPNLIHPVDVEVEKLSRSTTIVDDDFREPIQQGDRSLRVTVPGQPKWLFDDKNIPSKLGSDSEADGYVLFRTQDLRAADGGAGITIDQGDRFISLGTAPNKRDIDVYVIQVQPAGHYDDQGGPSLIRAFFKDRHPSRQTRGGK
jgi:hypothetical protein